MFSVNPFAGFFLLTSFSSVVTRDSNRIVLWSADCLTADGCGGCASEVEDAVGSCSLAISS